MFRFSLPVFLALIATIAGPELAAQSKSEKQLKKAIFKKFEIDIEETKTRFAESDERGLGESFTESLMKSWEEATFEFLEDGNTEFRQADGKVHKSTWTDPEYDVENQTVTMQADGQEVTVEVLKDGRLVIDTSGIVIVVKPLDTMGGGDTQKRQDSPPKNQKWKVKVEERIIGTWTVSKNDTNQLLKDNKEFSDKARRDANTFCERGIQLVVSNAGTLELKDHKNSRKHKFRFPTTDELNDPSLEIKKPSEAWVTLILDDNPQRQLFIGFIDGHKLVARPNQGNRDEPSLIFDRDQSRGDKSTKLDPKNAEKLLVGSWSLDIDASIKYIETHEEADEEQIKKVEELNEVSPGIIINFEKDGSVNVESNENDLESEGEYEITEKSLIKNQIQMTVDFKRFHGGDEPDVEKMQIRIIDQNQIMIRPAVPVDSPAMIFKREN